MKATTLSHAGADTFDLVDDEAAVPMTRRRRDSLDFPTEVSPELFERVSDVLFEPARPSHSGDAPAPRRLRRTLIRLVGYSLVGVLVAFTAHIARQPRARTEMASWGTMGHPAVASTAARGVRGIAQAVVRATD